MLQFNLNGQCVFVVSPILITSTFCYISIAEFFQNHSSLISQNYLALLFLSQSHMLNFAICFIPLSWLCLVKNPKHTCQPPEFQNLETSRNPGVVRLRFTTVSEYSPRITRRLSECSQCVLRQCPNALRESPEGFPNFPDISP